MGGIGPDRTTAPSPARAEASEGLLAQLPPSYFVETLVRLPILIQSADPSTFEGLPAGNLAGTVQNLIQRLDSTPWGHAVELLYQLLGDAEQPPSSTEVDAEGVVEEDSADLFDETSLAVPVRAGATEVPPQEMAGEPPSVLSPAVLAGAAVLVYQGSGTGRTTRRKQLPSS